MSVVSSPLQAAIGVGNSIGRYFGVVTVLPALLLILWVWLLIASHSWTGRPDLNRVMAAVDHVSVQTVIWLVLSAVATGLFLHPLQYATTQLLEGYWGTSSVALGAMASRIHAHRRRFLALVDARETNREAVDRRCDAILLARVEDQPEPAEGESAEELWESMRHALLNSAKGNPMIRHLVGTEEANRLLARYPREGRRIMPTRLGNALRSFEDVTGSQYGLSAITVAPHLHLIAPERHLGYLTDGREEMDASIRLCVVSLLASIVTVGFLLPTGYGCWPRCSRTPWPTSPTEAR